MSAAPWLGLASLSVASPPGAVRTSKAATSARLEAVEAAPCPAQGTRVR